MWEEIVESSSREDDFADTCRLHLAPQVPEGAQLSSLSVCVSSSTWILLSDPLKATNLSNVLFEGHEKSQKIEMSLSIHINRFTSVTTCSWKLEKARKWTLSTDSFLQTGLCLSK